MMKAIILAGMPAVGKTTVAKIIASNLSLKVVGGGDILKEIALEEGYNAIGGDWWDTEEGMRFLEERKGSPEFDKQVDQRLLDKARRGDIVITSYTLPWLAKEGLKIWLSGTKESRAERMAKRDGSSPEDCAKVIDARDRENYALYKKVYGIRFGEDLDPFTMVVGTDGVPAEKVANLILEQISRNEGSPAREGGTFVVDGHRKNDNTLKKQKKEKTKSNGKVVGTTTRTQRETRQRRVRSVTDKRARSTTSRGSGGGKRGGESRRRRAA